MGVWASGSQFAGYDYAQTSEPVDPEEGEMWYDMDSDRSLVYTGTEWEPLNIIDHGQLAGITDSAHHNPVSVEGPLRLSSGQVLDLAASDGLTLDADGRLRVAADSVTQSMLAFDVVTQSELTSHASDGDAHHSKTTSAAELSDVSPDSAADAHHSRPVNTVASGTLSNLNMGSGVTYEHVIGTGPQYESIGIQITNGSESHTIHTYEGTAGPFLVSFNIVSRSSDLINEIDYRVLEVQ